MAKISFFKKDYLTAREFISKVVYDNYFMYAESKLIECRILYEEKNFAELMVTIDSALKYMKSHKEIGEHHKETYSAFLHYLHKLAGLYETKQMKNNISFEIQNIEKELTTEKCCLRRGWLRSKLDELK
jgi:hypothetical protein